MPRMQQEEIAVIQFASKSSEPLTCPQFITTCVQCISPTLVTRSPLASHHTLLTAAPRAPHLLRHDGVLSEVLAGADGDKLGGLFGGLAAGGVPTAGAFRQLRVPPHAQAPQDLRQMAGSRSGVEYGKGGTEYTGRCG